MLNLSRLRPDPIATPFFATIDNAASEPGDNEAFASRLVATLELGRQAALVVGSTNGATLASNALASTFLKDPHFIKELKSRLQAHDGNSQSSFLWRDASEQLYMVQHSPVADSGGLLTLVLLKKVRQDETALFNEFVRHFNVTSAEARLLAPLLRGELLMDISKRLGLSKATVKSQLRSLLARTGTERQAALVAFYFSNEW